MSTLSSEQLMGGFLTDYKTIQTHLNHNYNEPRKDIDIAVKKGDRDKYPFGDDCTQTISFKTVMFPEFSSITVEMSRKKRDTTLKIMLFQDTEKIDEGEITSISDDTITRCLRQLIIKHHPDNFLSLFKTTCYYFEGKPYRWRNLKFTFERPVKGENKRVVIIKESESANFYFRLEHCDSPVEVVKIKA